MPFNTTEKVYFPTLLSVVIASEYSPFMNCASPILANSSTLLKRSGRMSSPDRVDAAGENSLTAR